MGVGQAASYSIHGFLTRMVPGGVAALSVYFMSGGNSSILTTASPMMVLVMIAAFYITGEIIEYFRLRISPVPKYFGRVLYTAERNPDFLTPSDTVYYHLILRPKLWINSKFDSDLTTDDLDYNSIFGDTDEETLSHIRTKFKLPENYSNTKRLYKIFIKRLDLNLSTSAQRIQRSYIFFQNIKISAGLGIVFALLLIVSQPSLSGDRSSDPIALIVILGIVLIYASTIFSRVDEEYVDTLLVEFYNEVNLR